MSVIVLACILEGVFMELHSTTSSLTPLDDVGQVRAAAANSEEGGDRGKVSIALRAEN